MHVEVDSSIIDFAISHNREDLELAETLLTRLEAAGLVGWIDSRAFYSPLVSAERQIERAFRKARFICLLVGDRYRDSAWCREEYSLGLRSEADLSITRVLVVTESSTATALVPEALMHAPRFSWTVETEMQECGYLISNGRNTGLHLASWRDMQGKSKLVIHLPTIERIKLVGDHVAYLLSNFANGVIDLRNHQSAILLGIIGGAPSAHVSHLSPALAIEMCWRWTSEIVGKYSLRRFLEEPYESDDVSRLHISNIRALFVKILPIFRTYLEMAVDRRRNPPKVTEDDLFAILDFVICGFLAVICKANQCDQELLDGVRGLLKVVEAHGDKRLVDVADYLSRGIPTIGLPEFHTSRVTHIYDLLHQAST